MLFGVQSTNNVFTLRFTASPVHGWATSKALQIVRENIIPFTMTSPGLKHTRDNADRLLFLLTDGENFNVLYYQLLL